ncbi:hypothetical protein BC943DRAFT_354511 [Umbelopsis sp. AD052]|nr:hypothetical protein BC943DRAFT_354511 [Umbelopsis sp. AD052]
MTDFVFKTFVLGAIQYKTLPTITSAFTEWAIAEGMSRSIGDKSYWSVAQGDIRCKAEKDEVTLSRDWNLGMARGVSDWQIGSGWRELTASVACARVYVTQKAPLSSICRIIIVTMAVAAFILWANEGQMKQERNTFWYQSITAGTRPTIGRPNPFSCQSKQTSVTTDTTTITI